MSNNTPRNLVITDTTTYTILLYQGGVPSPVSVYKGCSEYHTRPDCNTLVFKSAGGHRVETNMLFEAVQE